jgi:hypothetical protein
VLGGSNGRGGEEVVISPAAGDLSVCHVVGERDSQALSGLENPKRLGYSVATAATKLTCGGNGMHPFPS